VKPIDYIEPLSASPIGISLGSSAIRELLAEGKPHRFPKDTMIFQEGDSAGGIWLVLDGLVKLTRYTYEGREIILHIAEPFLIIAEAAVFLGRYPATAISNSDTTLLYIPKELLFSLMEKYPTVQRRLFASMSNWLKMLVDKVDQLTLNDATARLIRYLFSLSDPAPSGKAGKPITVELPMKKGELAIMLNMNQATLSRTLRKLQDDGLLKVNARKVALINIDRLKRLSQPPLL